MATRDRDNQDEWNDRTHVDDLDDRTEELEPGPDVTLPQEDSAEDPAPTPAHASTPDVNVRVKVSAVASAQGTDADFQKSRQLFRDAMQDLRAGRLDRARMNLKLASTYAPEQLSPRALNTFLGEATDLEVAWRRADLVQRFAYAAARGVPVAELREQLEAHARAHGQAAGRPTTVEQLLDAVSRLPSAKPRAADDPVPFTRVALPSA